VRQIVDKIGSILQLYTFDKNEWGVTEVSRELGIPKSSVSELMTSMASQGLIERVPPGRYRLGWRWFSVNQVLLDSSLVLKEGRLVLNEMAERYGESCHLTVFERFEAILVEKAQANLTTQILMSKVGTKLPVHATASGKLLIAHQPWADFEKAIPVSGLDVLSPHTITSPETLMAELETVRRAGVAFDREEYILGLSSIAAPVMNAHGKLVAALGISMPAHRLAEQGEQFTLICKQSAARLSSRLGYTVGGLR
jgi:IclR family transcriptional regulator, KDG regulon repressor